MLRNKMNLKLIRKTVNGDLRLDGLPVYIAGTVDAVAKLPQSGDAIGECYWVGNATSKLLYLWNGDFWACINSGEGNGNGVCNDTAIDPATINQTLLQTGFPAIT